MEPQDNAENAMPLQRILGAVVLISYGLLSLVLLDLSLQQLLSPRYVFLLFVLWVVFWPFLALEFMAGKKTKDKTPEVLKLVPNRDSGASTEPVDNVESAAQPQWIPGVVVLILYSVFLGLVLFDPSLQQRLFTRHIFFSIFIFSVFFFPFLALEFMADKDTKKKISQMLKPVRNSDTVAAEAILAFFDLIYAPRFLTPGGRRPGCAEWTLLKAWRWAFLPSMLLTMIATYVLTYHVFSSSHNGVNTTFWSGIVVNVISDYLALFVIRRWLNDAAGPPDPDRESPLEALFFAVFAGILLVISFTGLRLILFMMIDLIFGQCYLVGESASVCMPITASGDHLVIWDERTVREMLPRFWELHRPGVLAASIVHLWLPGFAILAYMLRVLNRWLRKRERVDKDVRKYLGDHYPVLTLGILAGLMAFALVNLKFFAWRLWR